MALAVGSQIPMDDLHLLYKYAKGLGPFVRFWNFYYSHYEYYKTFMGQYVWCLKELEEMDLDAILLLHPELVVVDELAHTNVEGSRHEKRWQIGRAHV